MRKKSHFIIMAMLAMVLGAWGSVQLEASSTCYCMQVCGYACKAQGSIYTACDPVISGAVSTNGSGQNVAAISCGSCKWGSSASSCGSPCSTLGSGFSDACGGNALGPYAC